MGLFVSRFDALISRSYSLLIPITSLLKQCLSTCSAAVSTRDVQFVQVNGASTEADIYTMANASLRRRRGTDDAVGNSDDVSTDAMNEIRDDAKRAQMDARQTPSNTFKRAFLILLVSRIASASLNLIHDCDETYNFWEPLHYLVNGVGLQTWEHSPTFGLRSYFYLSLHYAIAKPVSLLVQSLFAVDAAEVDQQIFRAARIAPFYAVRLVLASASAFADASLASEISKLHPLAGSVTLASLAWSAGCFVYSSSFLPSSFAGICITIALAYSLKGNCSISCASCVAAVVWGWPFSGVAAIPIGIVALRKVGFFGALIRITIPLVTMITVSISFDTYFYGTYTFSTLNILKYNVFPKVASQGANLYGTEQASFYAKNLSLNFAHLFFLALTAPVLGAIAASKSYGRTDGTKGTHVTLLVTYCPFLITFVLFSTLAHKEERFMYVAYSSLCAGAGCGVAAVFDLAIARARRAQDVKKGNVFGRGVVLSAALFATVVCIMTAVFGTSRIVALLHGYGAPLRAYTIGLPADHEGSTTHSTVCIGDEWYRFPSSFHLPSDKYRVRFLDANFDGALPVPFDQSNGGTSFSPKGLNDQNVGEKTQRVTDAETECDFVVEFLGAGEVEGQSPYLGKTTGKIDDPLEETNEDDDDDEFDPPSEKHVSAKHSWRLIWQAPFLDAGKSPSLSRAFYVPGWSTIRNSYGTYRVFQKTSG